MRRLVNSYRRSTPVGFAFGLWICLTLAVSPLTLGETTPSQSELFFSLSAEADSLRLAADVRSAGRLLVERRASETEGLVFSLIRPLEAPWKFYRVDPIGPAGDEAKLAAVVTLDAPDWSAVERARKAVEQLGRRVHTDWKVQRGSDQILDGSFAFLVIGPEQDRFQVMLDPTGRVTGVVNRLTDRWLTGDLDPLLKSWQAEGSAGRGPEGYWFWNEGEAEPFDWEPHTYHGFAQALELLSRPIVPQEGLGRLRELQEGESYSLPYPELAEGLRSVLATLAPKAASRFPGRGGVTARFSIIEKSAEKWVVEANGEVEELEGARSARLLFRRRVTWRSAEIDGGFPVADELELEIISSRARLSLSVGHRLAVGDASR